MLGIHMVLLLVYKIEIIMYDELDNNNIIALSNII